MARKSATKEPKNNDDKIVRIVKRREPEQDVKQTKSGIAIIPGVKSERLTTLLIGQTTLMCHKFSEKLRKQIVDKHKGEASAGREKKDPEANFQAARYRLTDGSDGVPAGGVKAAIVKGFSKASGVPMTKAKGAIRVVADDPQTNLVRILGPDDKTNWPAIENNGEGGVVRNASGVIDIRHRPVYWPWAMRVVIEWLPAVCSSSQVLQAVAMSGFIEGLCEWRPGSKESLSGSLGTWRIANAEEVAAFERDELFPAAAQPKKAKLRRVV